MATGLDLLMTGVGIEDTSTGKFLPRQGWYATFATSIPDTSSENKNRRGFRFATKSENIVHSGVMTGKDFWENTLAVLENDAFRVREQIITNEAFANRFLGLKHYRATTIGDDVTIWSVGLGAGIVGTSPTGAIEVKNSSDTVTARADLFASGTGGASWQIKGSTLSGRIFVDTNGVYAQFGSYKPQLIAGKVV